LAFVWYIVDKLADS